MQWKKDMLFRKRYWANQIINMQKKHPTLYLYITPYTKLNSQWIINLDANFKLEEKSLWLGIKLWFLRYGSKSRMHKRTNWQIRLHQNENTGCLKEVVLRKFHIWGTHKVQQKRVYTWARTPSTNLEWGSFESCPQPTAKLVHPESLTVNS